MKKSVALFCAALMLGSPLASFAQPGAARTMVRTIRIIDRRHNSSGRPSSNSNDLTSNSTIHSGPNSNSSLTATTTRGAMATRIRATTGTPTTALRPACPCPTATGAAA